MKRRLRDDRGVEVLEFALVFPVVAFLLFGLIYTLLTAGAYLSLTHGAMEGVRYASIPTDPIAGTYPTAAAVASRVQGASPFYAPSTCQTTVAGGGAENQPVSVSVSCTMFNPLGGLVGGLGKLLAQMAGASSSSSSSSGGNLTLSITATSRSE